MSNFKFFKDFGVRAWLATIVVLPTVLVLCKLAWNGSEYATVTLVGMASAVIGTYFYQRRKG